ncbi:hypothetical protein [Vibrio europaeus]
MILADQVKSLDWKALRAKTIDTVSTEVTDKVCSLVTNIVNG